MTVADVTPAFKVCGLTRPEDARSAEAAGAAYVGSIFVPGSPRAVGVDQARRIAEAVRVPLAVVVADLPAEETVSIAEAVGAGVIQLHGAEDESSIEAVRDAGTWQVWKVVRPRSEQEVVAAATRFGALVDLLLVDAWHPTRLGGTGSRADWSRIATIRERVRKSVRFGLAGGLDPDNVGEAIRTVEPELLDVSSGVESAPGLKEAVLIEAFAEAIRTARSTVGERERE